jgi:hypothetical protein
VSQFRATSFYDPDLTGVGHQPYQYDQVSAMYGSYIVTECRYEVTFSSPTVSGLYVGANIIVSPSGTASAKTVDTIVERAFSTVRIVPSTGNQQVTVSGTIRPWDYLGVTKPQYMADLLAYGAATNANPTLYPTLEVFVVDPLAGTSAGVIVQTKLSMSGQLFNYIAPATS